MTELNSSLCQLNWLISKRGEAKNEKPPYSYTQLIRMAIENSPAQRCSLNGIYNYIMENFKYFRENRNASWKNSVRHNLSLNKQFRRLEKKEGEKGSLWIYVNAPERRLRSLQGSPPRVNPTIERLYINGRLGDRLKGAPSERAQRKSARNCSVQSNEDTKKTESLLHDTQLEEEDDLSDLSLFASQDLSASFKAVYEQLFPNDECSNRSKTEEQIDWLKIGMETAGIDYRDEEELRNLDTDRFCGEFRGHQIKLSLTIKAPIYLACYMDNMFPEIMSRSNDIYQDEPYDRPNGPALNLPQNEQESEDEFDWSSIT
ncbi:unnamed protein product [Nippostrongylus brasiliensis]|uniref:Forkhead box protein G1 (inferred by orthology to a human protein) n=1 Tax=Nippostrongylus brasiliensis TaxID=27835 RepID=A0A0N4YN99_NIPBR|nr:unnamed protein product [Nippostrongylus brasiliensis]